MPQTLSASVGRVSEQGIFLLHSLPGIEYRALWAGGQQFFLNVSEPSPQLREVHHTWGPAPFSPLGPEHIFSGSTGHPWGSTGADSWFAPHWMTDGSRPRLFYPVKLAGKEQKQGAYTLLKLGLDKKIVSCPPPSTSLDVRIFLWIPSSPDKEGKCEGPRVCFGAKYILIIPFYTCDCHANFIKIFILAIRYVGTILGDLMGRERHEKTIRMSISKVAPMNVPLTGCLGGFCRNCENLQKAP